jgi:hypothetical protein
MAGQMSDCVRALADVTGRVTFTEAGYQWTVIESSLGLQLPDDYKAMAENLPAGWFRRFVRLVPPAGQTTFMRPDVAGELDVLRESNAAGDVEVPYPIFPEPGGLLPWGITVSGTLTFWLTQSSDPGQWPVIIATPRYGSWDVIDGTACDFLTAIARAEYDTADFYEGPIRQTIDGTSVTTVMTPITLDGREPVFSPDPDPASQPCSTGTLHDFWARKLSELGNDRIPANDLPALRKLIGPPQGEVIPIEWDP